MSTDLDVRKYVNDLEDHLQVMVFGGGDAADSQAAVLLVRGAMASGDLTKAARLASATQQLADRTPGSADMAAAADHTRGLVERDSGTLERAASAYPTTLARARAAEDAGLVCAERGKQQDAVARLREAYELYEQLGIAESMARVRSALRAEGIRVRHWAHAERPAFGWESLTDTERRIADLVARGLSNRQVAGEVFLSAHTVAFHLRHVFGKLGVSSRVHLARLAAERANGAAGGDGQVGSSTNRMEDVGPSASAGA